MLTGGSSNISGIETLGCDILKLPVRVGCPLHITGITDALRDPAYATGVGLLLWGAKNGARRTTEWTGGGFGFPPEEPGRQACQPFQDQLNKN